MPNDLPMSEFHPFDYPKFSREAYSDATSLQNVTVCLPRLPTREDSKRIWVVYIHGGAWRDPFQSSETFQRTLQLLLNDSILDNIAGFASINYGLSPYPRHPTNPSKGDDPARNAKHPDHIHDVLAALAFLQTAHGFEERYMLVGHSAGATLAFQVAMGRWRTELEQDIILPIAILGLEGIYDLVALRERYAAIPIYKEFIQGAFGESKEALVDASPISGRYATSWTNARVAVLTHSSDDELIDEDQHKRMEAALKRERGGSQHPIADGPRRDIFLPLKGTHAEIWQKGHELVRAIKTAISFMLPIETRDDE